MARSITVNSDNVEIEGEPYDSGDTVEVSNSTFNELTAAGRFSSGLLTDNGVVGTDDDEVQAQGDYVADVPDLTAPADISATYTEAEVQALRDDLAALHSTVNSLLAALRGDGKPLDPTA